MLKRADGHDREAALHKAMVERIRNGIFPDDPVEVKQQAEGTTPQEVELVVEGTPARTAA